jgi:hypothetical protein
MVLNDGSKTLLSSRGTFTVPDISMAHTSIAHKLTRKVLPNVKANDHFPILINIDNTMTREIPSKKVANFIEAKADWKKKGLGNRKVS